MDVLDRGSPMPLWAQLEAHLRARIAAGDFEDRFPTDAELVAHYGVSRHTARAAVRQLQASGLVERERGRGSRLPPAAELEQSIAPFYTMAAAIAGSGLAEHARVLRRSVVRHRAAAARLGLAPDAELVHIRRLRFAGDEPLALDDSWLVADVGRRLLDADLERGSLYERLATAANVRVTTGTERIRAALPDAAERKLLALPRGEAMLVVERVAYADERAVEYRRSLVRGDRVAFVANWQPSGGELAGRGAPARERE